MNSRNRDSIHNSGDECCLYDHCAGRNATLLVSRPPTCVGRWEGMASVVDGRHSVAGERKETGQKLLIAHVNTSAIVPKQARTAVSLWVEH